MVGILNKGYRLVGIGECTADRQPLRSAVTAGRNAFQAALMIGQLPKLKLS